ncbi:TonB-dependent receptor [Porticoccaceae bacterium]|nr:TonB-dependent receptor [Porticoccaceae bacterium]
MTNLPRLNKNPPMPQQQPCKAASATVTNTPSKIPTKTLSQTLSKTKPPHKTSAPNKANTPDKTNSSKNKPQINSGFFLPTHYKRCKATSGNNAVNRLVGILSIVCLLLGTVSATANTAQQQHDSGSNGSAPSNPEALNKETSATLAHEFFISIPPLNAAEALNRLAKQTGAQLLYSYEQALTRKAHPVVGQYAVMDALTQLLKGSGLEGSLSNKGAITISDSEKVAHHNQRERMNMNNKTIAKKTLLAAAVGLFAAGGMATASAQDQVEGVTQQSQIDEIIVTATKRSQSLQDTAMAISALSSDTIDKRNLVGMGDYLSSLPGVTVLDQGPGFNTVVIRGLSARPQFEGVDSSPVSGVYFGETAVSGFGISGNSADIKLVDMERIEVLRGPQGTLYGAGAMGGVVRNIPKSPSLEEVEGKLQFGASSTADGGSNNNSSKGVINIPLIENVLAVRAVAYRFDNSGYYKNVAASDPVTVAASTAFSAVAINQDDIGSNEVTGGRVSVLWQPTDQLQVNLSYLSQDINQDGWGQADLDIAGGFSQRRFNVRTNTTPPDFGEPDQQEGFTDDIEITNLTVEYDFDWATVSSSTSLVDEVSQAHRDLSGFFGSVYPWSQTQGFSGSLFSEEIRLSSSLEGPWQFLVGFYYEDRETGFENTGLFGGTDPALSSIFGTTPGDIRLFHDKTERDLQQQAFFGELSYSLTETVKLTLGARVFDYDREVIKTTFDSAFNPGGAAPAKTDTTEKDTSFKAGVEYTPNDDTLLYATWSEGFRLGYPVAAINGAQSALCDQTGPGGVGGPDGIYDGSNGVSTGERLIDSDFVENFELGAKLSLLDSRLTVNAAVYEINWEGIPISTQFTDSCFALANAGEARSRGIEFDLAYGLSENLLINLSSSYVDAELTIDAPRVNGSKGDRLPGSANVNVSLGVEYQFMVASYDAYLRTDYAYVGGFYNNLKEEGLEAGDYNKLNIKLGVRIDQFDVDLYVDNLTNEDNLTWVDSEGFVVDRGNRLRPRTIGFNVGYQF